MPGATRHCSYGACRSDSRKNLTSSDSMVRFFRFPKPCLKFRKTFSNKMFSKTSKESKHFVKLHVSQCSVCEVINKWVVKCKRQDGKLASIADVSKDTYICSLHFPANTTAIDPQIHIPGKVGGKRKNLKDVKTPKSRWKSNKSCTTSKPVAKKVVTDMSSGSCFVPHCNAKEAHKFSAPKGAGLRRQWESIIGRTDGRALTENDVVCELHFMKSMIQVAYEKQEDDIFRGVKKLVDEAVPTIFPNVANTTESAPTTNGSQSSPLPSTSRQGADTSTKKVKRTMKRKCCVTNCQSLENPSTTLHQFPVQAGRRKTWLNLLNMSDFKPTKLTRVCSKHFTSSSFSNPGELRADAIPKLYSSCNRKLQQESDPDSLLSEAQKTAAWLQSVKQKREERKQKRLLGVVGPTPRKIIRAQNPWGVKDCEVVISYNERSLADVALNKLPEDQFRSSRCLDVPMPIVEVKEEPPEIMDLTVDDMSQMESVPLPPPPPPSPKVRPILPKPKLNPQQLAVPPVMTANNLMFQTTLRSAAEVKSVQDKPLPPSTIYRVIIPTSVQGHTIEPNSILQQLKDKISAMHLEKLTKQSTSAIPHVPVLSTPMTKATSIPVLTKVTSSTPATAPFSPKTLENATVVKSSKLILTEKVSAPVGDHAYASRQNRSTWPILLQTPVVTPAATPTTSTSVASTSSGLPSTTQTPSGPHNLEISSYGSVTPLKSHPVAKSTKKTNNPQKLPSTQPLIPTIAYIPQVGTMKVVPNMSATGENVNSFLTFRTLSIGTQTSLAIENQIPQKQVREMKKSNESYRVKIKQLRQSLRRVQSRLMKKDQELEELKSLQTLVVEQEKGKENIIVIEATEKCSCFKKRREHEDVGDILQSAVQRKIPPPEESKALLAENEKLIKRIGFIKKKLIQKEILRVVVFQTEDLLGIC